MMRWFYKVRIKTISPFEELSFRRSIYSESVESEV